MKPFVLIVDDSLTVRMDLRRHFTTANFAVMACGTLSSARTQLRSQSYDLAILDVTLPDGSGAALLSEIKNDPELCHIPVILLSASVLPETEGRPSYPRAEAFVVKPFEPAQLLKLADELCKSSMGGKRFLLVDDSPTFLNALAGQLRQEGNTVLQAATGEEALATLQHEQVGCVVIDMVMPGIGGIETCRRLRTQTPKFELPVIMLTASENTSGRSQGLAIGADQFLIKSHRFDLLCAQIRGLLRKKNREQRSAAELPAAAAQEPSPASGSLHDKLLSSLGISRTMAQLVLTRACRSLELAPESITPADLSRLLPKLCDFLKMFLTPEQIAERVTVLQAVAQSMTPTGKQLASSAG